jgi:hypothetical protein
VKLPWHIWHCGSKLLSDRAPVHPLSIDALDGRACLFRVVDVDNVTMKLEYFSTRQGLAPMVVGLLKGLGIRFNTTIDIVHARSGDHDEFTISMKQAAA